MNRNTKLELTNPNYPWVNSELEKLLVEWTDWQQEVLNIVDKPYDQRRQSEVFADGEEMMRKHEVLQAKTLVFLNNNILDHGFLGFDRLDLRLKLRVKHRVEELEVLRACLQYAKVPEGFWKQKGKELVDHLAKKTGDAAIEAAASYLRNPLGS